MLMLLVAASAAFAAKKPQVEADVVVSREIAAPASVLFERVTDLEQWPALFPEPCASDWQVGLVSKGVGATAEAAAGTRSAPGRRALVLISAWCVVSGLLTWPNRVGAPDSVAPCQYSTAPCTAGSLGSATLYVAVPVAPRKPTDHSGSRSMPTDSERASSGSISAIGVGPVVPLTIVSHGALGVPERAWIVSVEPSVPDVVRSRSKTPCAASRDEVAATASGRWRMVVGAA